MTLPEDWDKQPLEQNIKGVLDKRGYWRRHCEDSVWSVEPGSVLSRYLDATTGQLPGVLDERRIPGNQIVSNYLLNSYNAMFALSSLWTREGMITAAMEGPLMRAALLPALTVAWVCDPADESEVHRRMMALEARNHFEEARFWSTFSGNTGVGAPGSAMALLFAPTEEAASNRRLLTKMTVVETSIWDAGAKAVLRNSDGDEQELLTSMWRFLSADAHALMWGRRFRSGAQMLKTGEYPLGPDREWFALLCRLSEHSISEARGLAERHGLRLDVPTVSRPGLLKKLLDPRGPDMVSSFMCGWDGL